ncbi:uracil-DNA glycosylase [Dermacoccus abyssi]|uniref:uracil-DNA glycosylase n=1 Tax=Dermacoccus abyssi TaxID=322596 RepID=UPI002AD33E98|nr:uracil-DNA glycosylase [Dermacoccus abyssi]
MTTLPHPGTGEPFASPVPPGTGWPADPARPRTRLARSSDDVERLAASSRSLEQLDARVTVCRACPRLVAWRESVARDKRAAFAGEPYWGRPVAAFGSTNPHGLIVGLAPAANGANRTGRMFTGDRSGEWLFASLHRVGIASQPVSKHAGDALELDGVRITSPVHCAPPDNVPTSVEKATCSTWLVRELQLLEPGLRTVVTLGGIAWTQTLGVARRLGWEVPRPAPRFGHGAEVELRTAKGRPITLLGCYHVSQRNTQTGVLTEDMLDAVLARLHNPIL